LGLLGEFCVPFLLRARNLDGGWGYSPGLPSGTEATSWAALALSALDRSELSGAIESGANFLRESQRTDGSWSAFPGQADGCWVTSVACLALGEVAAAATQVERGRRWLCNAWPGEGGLLWRLRNRLAGDRSAVSQNHSLRGWSWTRGTSSWVEPTSFALLALRDASTTQLAARAASRCRMGAAMLLDRMCPGGGWNCGNPSVYGTPGQPLAGPTAWALTALAGRPACEKIRQSLDWLARIYPTISSPASLALAAVSLRAWGRAVPPVEPRLCEFAAANEFVDSVPSVAWAVLALTSTPRWLRGTGAEAR
jgi:squalene cyclase